MLMKKDRWRKSFRLPDQFLHKIPACYFPDPANIPQCFFRIKHRDFSAQLAARFQHFRL